MEGKTYAVITGDVVRSTSIEKDYNKTLNEIAKDIKHHKDADFQLEIFRGDSFQGLIQEPSNALLISILIRAGLRRHSRQKSNALDDIWDARISIGIGGINTYKPGSKVKIGSLDGEAFVRSGKTLDRMKSEKALLKITTNELQIDHEFNASCSMADAIIGRWSNEQSEAIYLYLLENLTQEEISKRLKKISQRAVGKRLLSSNVESLKNFLNRYKEVIEWNYNK